MTLTPRPTIYGAYAHVWLREFAQKLPGRPLTLAEVPDAELDRLQSLGINWFWLIGAWQTGPLGRSHAVSHPDLRQQCRKILDDFAIGDMVGSPYAVQEYRVHRALGGDEALLALRARLAKRGIKLMLDLVPNHTACDHPWIREHPDYYVNGTLADLEAKRGFFAETVRGDGVILHGKDPYFEPWADTAQLDWRNPALVEAMTVQVEKLTGLCDGLRCDMAMLVLNDVFAKTWGPGGYPEPAFEPWSAIVSAARARAPSFVFLAEVYWSMEERLIKLGFDWVYDKVLYDRLRHDSAENVRGHLAGIGPIQPLAMRFLENHDEPRAASAFARARHQAAAVIASTLPGPFFVHFGQMEGRKEKLPIQLGRAPAERVDEKLVAFYRTLLKGARSVGGQWRPLDCRPAWDDSTTSSGFLANSWTEGARHLLAAVNFVDERGQCYVDLSPLSIPDGPVVLTDVLTGDTYAREGRELRTRGLYVELPAWGSHLFQFGK
jgi:hypothetical protein